MDEPIGKMEAHNKVPRGFLILLFGLIAFGVYYIAAYTPGISGWSQYKVLSKEMEAEKAKAAAGAAKMTENPYERDEKAVAEGQVIYAGKCAECHGKDLKGKPDGGPDLIRSETQNKSDSKLFNIISNGVKADSEEEEDMPAFKGKLSDDEINAAIEFIKSH
jgi:cytochrome c oxidase cbb3-type subunit 3